MNKLCDAYDLTTQRIKTRIKRTRKNEENLKAIQLGVKKFVRTVTSIPQSAK